MTREVMMKGKHFSSDCGVSLTDWPKVRMRKSRRIAEATSVAGLILCHETIHLMRPSDLETYIVVYRELFLSSPAFVMVRNGFACSALSQLPFSANSFTCTRQCNNSGYHDSLEDCLQRLNCSSTSSLTGWLGVLYFCSIFHHTRFLQNMRYSAPVPVWTTCLRFGPSRAHWLERSVLLHVLYNDE
jgi:hypothetical protein